MQTTSNAPFKLVAGLGLWLLVLMAFNFAATNANAAAGEPYGLDAMAQFERLPYLKLDTMAAGQSSFDRTGGNADAGNFLYTRWDQQGAAGSSGAGDGLPDVVHGI